MADITGVIATVFEPLQLENLVDDLAAAGAGSVVIKGQRTNAAWNDGLARVQTRYAVVLNDDIEVSADWVPRLLTHHAAGYTHVSGVSARTHAPVAAGSRSSEFPVYRGHLFSMDLSVLVPPIPEDLSVCFGDDWFYWHHVERGACCTALDVQVKTGWDLGYQHSSGWTSTHPEIEGFLGESVLSVARKDWRAARKYFLFPPDPRRPDEKPFPEAGLCPMGLVSPHV